LDFGCPYCESCQLSGDQVRPHVVRLMKIVGIG
jgi:hypothetical protein